MSDQNNLLPAFLIVGPPRTGTSWLHQVLQAHVCLPRVKETRFFDDRFHKGLAWYRSNFPECHLPVGEVAPTYFASAEARERIARLIPHARIVCIFRNPIDRIRSHYRLKRAYAMIPWEFEEALLRDPELMESSKYATYLRAWQETFGDESVRAMLYDDLKRDPQQFVDELAEFIGIAPFALAPTQVSHVHSSQQLTRPRNYYRTRSAGILAEWFKAHRLDLIVAAAKRSRLKTWFLGGGQGFDEMDPDIASNLCDQLRPEIEDLESMLGRDLASWKFHESRLLSAV